MHVIAQDGDELVLVLGLEQVFDGASGKLGKSLIGGGEDGQVVAGGKGVGKAGGLCGGQKRAEHARALRGFNDVGGVGCRCGKGKRHGGGKKGLLH
jgi:hypothetical protein